MRKIIFAVLGLAIAAHGQQSVNLNSQIGPTREARSQPWATVNVVNQGINYIWTPVPTALYSCITIADNTSGVTHTFAINSFITSDRIVAPPTVGGAINPRWNTLLNSGLNAVVASGNAVTTTIQVSGGAQVSLGLTASSSATGTYDFFETDSALPCFSGNGGLGFNFPITTGGPRPCQQSGTVTAATATATIIANAPANTPTQGAQRAWHICAYTISGPAATASAQLAINGGNAPGTCPAAPAGTNFWAVVAPIGIFNTSLNGTPEILTIPANNALCFTNGGIGVTATLSLNFDVW